MSSRQRQAASAISSFIMIHLLKSYDLRPLPGMTTGITHGYQLADSCTQVRGRKRPGGAVQLGWVGSDKVVNVWLANRRLANLVG